jgi:putative hydrolase of the HAD superfamily
MLQHIILKDIKFVLLDMDGTLLDLYFDEYFWGHLVPEKYAEKHNITFGAAKEYLFKVYRSHEKTLNWTDIDFWSRELHLDIQALTEQIKHLVEVHQVMHIKFKKTQIGKYFDSVICSFDVGYPKESIEFWQRAEKILKFDKEKTLFIDDTEDVLKAAKEYGIKYLLFKTVANSKSTPKVSQEFSVISDFRELMRDSI